MVMSGNRRLDRVKIAVVGATGAVGRELLSILEGDGVDASCVRVLASARSAGSRRPYAGGELLVGEALPESFAGVDVVFFTATAAVSKQLVPHAAAAGSLVVDNSSAFRLEPGVPLVVPEINGDLIEPSRTRWNPGVQSDPAGRYRDETAIRGGAGARVIANPNCSTIILLTGLEPLRRWFGIDRVHVCTYQAVSGAGASAIDELRHQSHEVLARRAAVPSVFREPCAFNVFSHNSAVDEATGLNVEERKIIDESRKIWGLPNLHVTPTCVRVPVERAHLEAVTVTLGEAAREIEVRAAFDGAAGIRVIDDRAANSFPTPLKAAGRDEVLVGRIRPDPGTPIDANGRTKCWSLLIAGDQLRKGAALNAVQIARRALFAPTDAGRPFATIG
jgi:aspartate-semialdehyde dehydrogenase